MIEGVQLAHTLDTTPSREPDMLTEPSNETAFILLISYLLVKSVEMQHIRVSVVFAAELFLYTLTDIVVIALFISRFSFWIRLNFQFPMYAFVIYTS